jgi:methionine-rich copper-binding protein CopC
MKEVIRFVVLLALAWPVAASAHAMLQHAEPSAGAVVHGSPAHVRLEFSEQLEPSFGGVVITDDKGRPAATSAATTSGMTMTVKLNALHAGRYHVQWHAVSTDAHRTEGAYSFTVGP